MLHMSHPLRHPGGIHFDLLLSEILMVGSVISMLARSSRKHLGSVGTVDFGKHWPFLEIISQNKTSYKLFS